MAKRIRFTFDVRSPRGQSVQTVDCDIPGMLKLGTLASSSVTIDDEDVSRIHATIEVVEEKKIRIIDLASERGTKVNRKRVTDKWIKDGDMLTLANTGIRIGIEAVDE